MVHHMLKSNEAGFPKWVVSRNDVGVIRMEICFEFPPLEIPLNMFQQKLEVAFKQILAEEQCQQMTNNSEAQHSGTK